MKIYYAASIWGAVGDPEFNRNIIAYLKNQGAVVLSEQLYLPEYKNSEKLDMKTIHDRDIAWIDEANVVVAECSSPSLGVGYEVRHAVVSKKKVILLYKPNPANPNTRLSAMVAGAPGVIVINYQTFDEAKEKIKEALWSKQQ